MKRFFSILLLLGAFLTSFVSCSKDDDNSANTTKSGYTSIEGTTWYPSDPDGKTSYTFKSNGVVTEWIQDSDDGAFTFNGSYTYKNGEGEMVLRYGNKERDTYYYNFFIYGSKMYVISNGNTNVYYKK